MTARKRSKEIRKAASQKVLEEVHRALYCDSDWDEDEVYGQRFKKIVERSNLDGKTFKVEAETAKEYRRRIERKVNGLEPLDKSLIFYRILTILERTPMSMDMLLSEIDNSSEWCISLNMALLEMSGLVEKSSEAYKVSISGKKLFLKAK